MRTVTFNYKGAVFQVQEDTVKSGVIADFVLYQLYPEPSDLEYRFGLDYGNFLARVTLVSGDPGFTIPSPNAPAQEIKAFHEVYDGLPRAFRNAYIVADTALLEAQNAANLTPGIDKKKPQTQTTEESSSTNSEALTDSSSTSPEVGSD